LRLSHQQEHWGRGQVEIKSAEASRRDGPEHTPAFSARWQAGGAEISNIFG
jgi:hypothetical protein